MLYAVLPLVFIDTILLVVILFKLLFREKPTERIRQYFDDVEEPRKSKAEKKSSKSIKDGITAISSHLFSILAFKGFREKVERALIRADIAFTAEEMLLVILTSSVIGSVLVYILSSSVVLCFIIVILICLLFHTSIDSRIKKRRHKMNEQLADALDMIAGSLRTGFSFLKAMEVTANDMGDPISKEFKRVIKEVDIGLTLDQALKNLLERMVSDDLELMITAVIIQRQVGGNLAEILDNISETIRARIALKREVKVLVAPGKVSGIIISLLPPLLGIILYIMDPKYIGTLFSHRIGIIMLMVALVNECIGFIIIKRMVEIEY